jgi:hypothetical protein
VEIAREGRAFGLFHPLEQIRLDSTVETRPYRWALVGLGMYYALVLLSVGGLVLLRRRRVPILPLLAVGLDVVVSVALTFGETRYRTTFELALVLAAAVQLDWVWGRFGRRSDRPLPDRESPDGGLATGSGDPTVEGPGRPAGRGTEPDAGTTHGEAPGAAPDPAGSPVSAGPL